MRRKVTGLMAAVILVLTHAAPAGASDANVYYARLGIDGETLGHFWYSNWPSVPFAIGNMSSFGGASSHAAVTFGPSQWNNVSGNALQYWHAGADNSINFTNECSLPNLRFFQVDTPGSRIGDADIAATFNCFHPADLNHIVGSAVLFNTTPISRVPVPNGPETNMAWYTSVVGGPVELWRLDLASIATHETGHAGGHKQHFDKPADCPTNPWLPLGNAGYQTMCAAPRGGTVEWRTLGSHDRSTVAARY